MLTMPVPEPVPAELTTNGDLLNLFLDYRDALRTCNANLAVIEASYGLH